MEKQLADVAESPELVASQEDLHADYVDLDLDQNDGVSLRSLIRLSPGVRLQYEQAQSCFVLLYPEGMMKLNDESAAVLQRCKDAVKVSDLIVSLVEEYDGDDISTDVLRLVDFLVAERLVRVEL